MGLLSYVSGQRFWFGQETETTGEEGRGSLILTKRPEGVTEREMRKVVVGPLWQLLWPGKKGSFGWF